MKKADCKLTRLTDLRHITAPELREEIAFLEKEGVAFQCALVSVAGRAAAAQLLFVPSKRRGGVHWGRTTQWGPAASMDGLCDLFWKIRGWMEDEEALPSREEDQNDPECVHTLVNCDARSCACAPRFGYGVVHRTGANWHSVRWIRPTREREEEE